MATEETAIVRVNNENRIVNPFAGETDDRLNAGTVAIESQRAVAEAQAQYLVAKRFPRNKAEACEKVLDSCMREEFANSALYAFPRGNKTVTGPSIRMAEELAKSWGNIKYGIKELAVYEEETEVYVYCIDLETNAISDQSFRSRHERKTGNRTDKLTDQRDIYENNANLGARRLRSRILAIMPSDLIAAAVAQVRQTLAGGVKGKDKPLSQKIPVLVREFNKLGITVAHLETKVGGKLEAMLPDDYADLVAIFNSLKDGQSQPSEWFAVSKAQGSSEKAQEVEQILAGNGKRPESTEPTPEEQEKIRQREQAESGELL